jgi:Zn-dependent protease with chaperone function
MVKRDVVPEISGAPVPEQRRSLAGRALVMLALFVGFYLLAIAVAVLLIAAPVIELALIDRLHTYLLFLSLVGLGILWSLVPRRRQKWVDPGPRFTAETQPELAALVRRVAGQVGQDMPAEMYLLDDINAFVTTRGGFMGVGGHRVLAVGVPLLTILDEEELASVLAHEFGHFHGGDTRLGPLVYRTRGAMERTLAAASGFVQGIFKAYASFYLARSQGISRAQEFAADRLSARVTSPTVAAQSLARLPHASAAFAYYRNNEYAPVLQSGRQPPYLAGFERMLTSSLAATDPGLTAGVALGSQTQSRFDSHPIPLDRIRALGVDPQEVVASPQPATPATALLRDPVAVEASLVKGHTGNFPSERSPVRWEDVGQEVLLPAWRSAVTGQLLPAAPQLTPASMPTSAEALADLGLAVYTHVGLTATRPEREATARQLCGQYLGVAAADAGWTVESLPGEPVRFARAGETFDVLNAYSQVCSGELDVEAWQAGLHDMGLSEPVASVSAARAEPAEGALQGAATSATAVHEPAPAPATTAEPPAQAGPAPLQYRGKPSLRRELVINGPTLQWGDRAIDAHDVTAVGYVVVNNAYDARFATPSGELKFHVNSGKKQHEAWTSVVRWSELYVEPRLVDQLLAQLTETGSVEVGGVMFTTAGINTRKGMLPWEEFAGTAFTGGQVTLHRKADNLDGHVRVAGVSTNIKHGGALVPQLCQAIMASRR